MQARRTYLDVNAGVPLLVPVREAMVEALGRAANPSSVHAEGRAARRLVEEARGSLAALTGADPDGIVFTSGATEAAALALTPTLHVGRKILGVRRLYVGATEHACVLAGGRFPPDAVHRLPVTPSGEIDLAALDEALAAHDPAEGPFFLALMLANNETGVIHPVARAAEMVKARGGIIFCDAVQAAGRIPIDIRQLGVDVLALSAHKIGGPQGAGALVLADPTIRPEPLLKGGGQEKKLRAGTENVAAIAGFGVAAQHARHHLDDAWRLAALRDALEAGLRAATPDLVVFGADAPRLPNTTLVAVPGVLAETAVIALDLEGIAVSSGSACSSGKVAESQVLAAMGAVELARGGVRISLPWNAAPADIDAAVAAWRNVIARMRRSRAA